LKKSHVEFIGVGEEMDMRVGNFKRAEEKKKGLFVKGRKDSQYPKVKEKT